jgi:hypothetical protein
MAIIDSYNKNKYPIGEIATTGLKKNTNFNKQYDYMSDHDIRKNTEMGLPSLFGQPYIIHRPNDPLRNIKKLDSRFLPIGSALEDVARIAKWTLSPTGLLWNAKQVMYQATSPHEAARVFNPLGPIGSIIPAFHISRTMGDDRSKNDMLFSNPPVLASILSGIDYSKATTGNSGGLYQKWQSWMDNDTNPINYGIMGKATKLVTSGLKVLGVNIPISRTIQNRWEIGLGSKNIMTSEQWWGKSDSESDPNYNSSNTSDKFSTLPYGDLISYGKKAYSPGLSDTTAGRTEVNKFANRRTIFSADKYHKNVEKDYLMGNPGKPGLDRSKRENVLSGTSDKLTLVPYGSAEDIKSANPKYSNLFDKSNINYPDFIPFKIYDIYNDKWIIFRATLSSMTDSITSDWSEKSYVGRPEKFPIYTGVSRGFNVSWKVYAGSRDDLKPMWTKLNYLIGLQYPNYRSGVMVSPIIKYTVGDIFVDMPGYFSSLTISYPDEAPWETVKDGKNTLYLPTIVDITADFKPLYKEIPQSTMKHIDGIPDSWLTKGNSTFLEEEN